MRRLVWSLVSVAALALAGCGNSSDSTQKAGAVAQAQPVTGTVTLRDAAQLSPAAKLDVSLVDLTQTSKVLASKTVDPVTSFPQSFELNYNAADVVQSDMYVVQAVLTDGERRYTMPIQALVITNGKNQADIQLVAEQTAGEKELAAFLGVQKMIGGMRITNGTKLEDNNTSRAWQVFRDGTEIKFIREQVDYGDKGFTSTDYAYKDGKPWVVVQQKKSSQSAKPNETNRAAWTQDGTLVLKTSEAGGKTSALSDDSAANLQKQAESILNLATGGKGK